jgi:hypothetical protein
MMKKASMKKNLIFRLIQKMKSFLYRIINRYFPKFIDQQNFKKTFKEFDRLSFEMSRADISFSWDDRFPILNEKTENTYYDRHYVYHTAWAARVLRENNINKHIDFSSCLRFTTIISAFIPTEFYDYRPATINLQGLKTGKIDLKKLHFNDNSIYSLSCMHVVEHIGLGRYGDELDPLGDLKAINELERVLARNGHLLFVVPIGKSRICFNAHRIYNPVSILDYFNNLKLLEFACVPDAGHLLRNMKPEDFRSEKYACGMYHFTKEI